VNDSISFSELRETRDRISTSHKVVAISTSVRNDLGHRNDGESGVACREAVNDQIGIEPSQQGLAGRRPVSTTNQELSLRVAATAQGHTCRLRFVPFWAGYLLASNRA
jgi:hypothetical protein